MSSNTTQNFTKQKDPNKMVNDNNNLSGDQDSAQACNVQAKDSEWIDTKTACHHSNGPTESLSTGVDPDSPGPDKNPLTLMFPDILDKDPRTYNGIINKTMSTTEVTKNLLELGKKADRDFLKKSEKLIRGSQIHLESVPEDENSTDAYPVYASCYSVLKHSDYEADNETGSHVLPDQIEKKKIRVKTKADFHTDPAKQSVHCSDSNKSLDSGQREARNESFWNKIMTALPDEWTDSDVSILPPNADLLDCGYEADEDTLAGSLDNCNVTDIRKARRVKQSKTNLS